MHLIARRLFKGEKTVSLQKYFLERAEIKEG